MSTYALAVELARTSELLQAAYAVLRQRDRDIQILQNNVAKMPTQSEVNVDNTVNLLKMLYPSHEEEYLP